MKRILPLAVIGLLILALVLDAGNVQFLPSIEGRNASLLAGLVLVSPILGLFYLLSRFVGWHLRFHRRMRGK